MTHKPKVAVHKFSSCDGCQLAFLNLGEDLLTLSQQIDIQHFAEAGAWSPDTPVDIAFVEGSISTPEEQERIQQIREQSGLLVTIGACATSGGIQALRNLNDTEPQWRSAIYAQPEFIKTLQHTVPISAHVKVDLELWGCPVNSNQLIAAINSLLLGVAPVVPREKLCLECKRLQTVCVMVTKGQACMGPVTQTGCGALCPRFGRDCYACYGPSENINAAALEQRFAGLGLIPKEIAQRFLFINSHAPDFNEPGKQQLPSGLYKNNE